MDERYIKLWEGIHDYVRACGGDPATRIQGNTARQKAVVAVHQAFEDALMEDVESAVAGLHDGQDQVEADLELRVGVLEGQIAEITAACDRCHVPGDDVVKRVKRMSAALVPKLDLSKKGVGR